MTDKWGFRHTCYVATSAQNLNDFHNSSLWTCSHLMAILRSQNKNTDFFMILASLCRFNVPNYRSIIIVNITFLDFHISMQLISETRLFHNFYELSFTGIDQNKEMLCILCTCT